MRSPIGSMNNVKIFVLYLMQNINYPMDFVTINDIVMQTDYIMYLDFAVAFHEMPMYSVTEKGKIVAEQLKSSILKSILEQSLSAALRYLDFKRRDVKISSDATERPDKTWDVTVTVTEKGKVIMKTSLNVDSYLRAELIRENFRSRPEVIYRGTVALLSGQMDYLFDK